MGNHSVSRRTAIAGSVAGVVGTAGLRDAPPAGALTTRQVLSNTLENYLRTRVGTVGLALYDHRTGVWFTRNDFTNQTLSTVKVAHHR